MQIEERALGHDAEIAIAAGDEAIGKAAIDLVFGRAQQLAEKAPTRAIVVRRQRAEETAEEIVELTDAGRAQDRPGGAQCDRLVRRQDAR